MLDRPGNAGSDVKVGCDDLAGLADLFEALPALSAELDKTS